MTLAVSSDTSRLELVESARDLFSMIREEAEKAETARRIPDHVFASLRESGFFRILQPRQFGGFEFEPATAAKFSQYRDVGTENWTA